MTIAIYSPNGSIATSDMSHRAGWAKMRADQMRAVGYADIVLQPKPEDLRHFDKVILYHGMECDNASPASPHWGKIPGLNLFGGANSDNAEKLMAPSGAKELYHLDFKWNYAELAKDRPPKDEGWKTANWPWLSVQLDKAGVKRQPYQKHLVIGDSHALAQYAGDCMVARLDYMTMHGVVARGITFLVDDFMKPYVNSDSLDHISIMFGQIDVRHHWCRPDRGGFPGIKNLLIQYTSQIRDLQKKYKCEIELIEILPIESPFRMLPKTGYYKGSPFYGSWDEREDAREFANGYLQEVANACGWTFYDHPDWFKDKKGQLRFEVMENSGSVHMAWKYRRQALIANDYKEFF